MLMPLLQLFYYGLPHSLNIYLFIFQFESKSPKILRNLFLYYERLKLHYRQYIQGGTSIMNIKPVAFDRYQHNQLLISWKQIVLFEGLKSE
jgi:hypothetical protein